MSDNVPNPTPEPSVGGGHPVQSFVCQAIPVGPDTPLEPRLGRPPRKAQQSQDNQTEEGNPGKTNP